MRVFLLLFLLTLSSCQSDNRPVLHLFVWSEYFSSDAIEQFEQEYNCRVILDTYDSNEAMYTKLRLGASGYDIIMPSNYIYETMVEQEMLRTIDFDRIPNLSNLNQSQLSLFQVKDLRSGVPYLMSYTGIGYIPSRVTHFDPSWTVFARKELQGRMTMLNDMREAMGAALITLGYDVNTRAAAEVEEAVQLLLKWRENLAKFESEQYKNGLANLEFLVVQGYNNDILQVISENDDAAFGWPKEGAIASIDLLAIPKNAKNPELAEQFINFCLRPEIAAETVLATFATCLVEIPEELLPQDPAVRAILTPSQEHKEKAQVIRNLGEALTLYSRGWERVLSGG